MTETRSDSDVPTGDRARRELLEAAARVEEVQATIDEHGESAVETVADAYRSMSRLLDQHEDTAVGTGDFGSYVRFQSAVSSLVSGLDPEMPGYEAFEAIDERTGKRRLNESDFEFARERLESVSEYVELLEEREAALDQYRRARHRATDRLAELREREEEYERLVELAEMDVDLDAPIDELREPIEEYNERVEATFETFRRERSARELFEFLETTERYPFVDYRQPPAELAEYVTTAPAGEEPLETLLEYADYSPSKLDHYVDDPGTLRTTVAVHRTYLDRLSADPLRIEWPPPPAGVFRFRLRELAAVTRRLDDPELESLLRRLRRLVRDPSFERLRSAAEARADLDEETFRRVVSGEIHEEYDRLVESIDALEDALEGTADRV